MARMTRRQTMEYRSYGNVAYAPEMEGGAVVAPRHEENSVPLPRRRVQQRTRTQTLTRAKVQTREAGEVAPVGLFGFGLAAVLAIMLMCSFVQNMVVSSELVQLQSAYSTAQVKNAALTAQYERVFDVASIEAAVSGTMVRPSADQVVYLDLSQPDAVNVYGAEAKVDGVAGLVSGMQEIVTDLIEYFGNE